MQISHLSVSHKKDLRPLIEDLSFVLREGDRCAVIGEEGNGKSTLLKIIAAPEEAEEYVEFSGEIRTGGAVIGYLKQELSEAEKADYSNLDYLKKNVYIVDSSTGVLDGELNGEKFLNEDFSIDTDTDGPKILIFHTHSHEGFADSDMSAGADEGIVGVGERLKDILETEYGIETMHCTESFDYVDSKMTTTGAYERMEPVIRQILDENPSIEIAIDLHRDGVADDTRLVTEIDGKSTAQIMFFNGLCRVYENGELVPAAGLDNANLEENLAFSFAMKYAGDKMFPGLVRRNYLKAYRYSLHMLPKSLLVEVGAQTNTKEEALNAMEPLAEMLVAVINKNT